MSDHRDDPAPALIPAFVLVTMLLLAVGTLFALSSCWGGWCCYAVASELWFTLLLATLSWGWQYKLT